MADNEHGPQAARRTPAGGSPVIVVAGLAMVAVAAVIAVTVQPRAVPSVSAGSSGGATVFPAGAFRDLSAPGISFRYPAEWLDATSTLATVSAWPGYRTIAVLTAGEPPCSDAAVGPIESLGSTGTASLSPASRCWDSEASPPPGSFALWVSEYVRPLPGTMPLIRAGAVGRSAYHDRQLSRTTWYFRGPDDGLYELAATYTDADAPLREPQVEAVLDTVSLDGWDAPVNTTSDGNVQIAITDSVSLAYPSGWSAFYPIPWAGMGGAHSFYVVVSSSPLISCAASDIDCGPGQLAVEGSIVVGIRVRFSPTVQPDWTKATLTIDGRPTVSEVYRTGDTEQQSLAVQLAAPMTTLEIDSAIRGPDLGVLRAELAKVLESVETKAS